VKSKFKDIVDTTYLFVFTTLRKKPTVESNINKDNCPCAKLLVQFPRWDQVAINILCIQLTKLSIHMGKVWASMILKEVGIIESADKDFTI
jgi:hypothetical protein